MRPSATSFRGQPKALSTGITAIGLSLLVALTTALAGGFTASAGAVTRAVPASYTPVTGVLFNAPIGSNAEQRALFTHIIATIDSVPAGGRIRIAVFSFADSDMAQALIRAHQRGVRVQLISAGGRAFPPLVNVQRVLGGDPTQSSYVVMCDHSCRGTGGQMHAKFFQFSRAGDAKWITMVGSNNITRTNAEKQWNDLYTVVDDHDYYRAYKTWFAQLKFDTPVERPFLSYATPNADVAMTPLPAGEAPDPTVAALDSVTCLTRAGDIDPAAADPELLRPTRIRIASYAWNGDRGISVARKVADLARAGCKVDVFYGDGMGGAVLAILGNAGIPLSQGTHKGVSTHQKLMIVKGHIGEELRTIRVYTGSSNWSSRAMARDDLIVTILDQVVGKSYLQLFKRMLKIA